jgi:hypothetical protein
VVRGRVEPGGAAFEDVNENSLGPLYRDDLHFRTEMELETRSWINGYMPKA